MVECLADDWLLVGGEGAADLGQHLGWGDGVRPAVGVVQQLSQGLALVGVGDTAAQGPPQPLDPVSVRVVGRGVDQHQVLAQLGKQPAQQSRPLGGVDAKVSKITMATRPRERERATARRSWAHSGAARRPSASSKSRMPSRQSTSPKP
jgi:hypothetical protein